MNKVQYHEMKSLLQKDFDERGFVGPIRVLSMQECSEIFFRTRNSPKAPVWTKANAVAGFPYYELATRSEILDRVRSLLGDDVLLWGASLVRRKPGAVHPWHTDIECDTLRGRSLTVWIGLEKTSRQSSLTMLSYSHHLGVTAQEAAHQMGKTRATLTTGEVLIYATQRDSRCFVETPEMQDGEALFFDGRIWHYSENTNPEGTRTAILLQYATTDTVVRIPEKLEYDWPFRFLEARPPCILVSGVDTFGCNETVDPPEPDPIWPAWIRSLDALKMEPVSEGWTSGHIFKGPIHAAKRFGSHVSVLQEEMIPHEPHAHSEEELLILLSGQVEIIRPDSQTDLQSVEKIVPGSFVYHAAHQKHTIRTIGPGSATYLMLKWKGKARKNAEDVLKSSTFHMWTGKEKERPGYKRIGIFQSPTLYLSKLRAHLSIMNPGYGYEPHSDPYDVAVLVLSGRVETLGQAVGPRSLLFYPAHKPHGMKNAGEEKTTYLVFEFHSASGSDENYKS